MDINQLPLTDFDPISLQEMDRVKLLNRTDTKYFFNESIFPEMMAKLASNYKILTINNKRTNDYKTLYYDTDDLKLYTEHHNGKKNRYKVRMRKYLDSDLCFLEVKKKTNKGRTDKKRIKRSDFELELNKDSLEYVNNITLLYADRLNAVLWNTFTRLTLVHKTNPERLTLDINLNFENAKGESTVLDNLVIAELKQEKFDISSDFVSAIKPYSIRPMRISKYCTGSLLLNPKLKYNRFKHRLRMINKARYGIAA